MASYSYLAEFNKQQKVLKEEERQTKAKTADVMHHYHGGEHDITEHEHRQANLRRAEQLTRQIVMEELHLYRHLTSPGVNTGPGMNGMSVVEPTVEEHESHVPPAEAENEAERIIETQADDAKLIVDVDGLTMEPMLKEDIVADAESSTASRIAAEAETKNEAAPIVESEADDAKLIVGVDGLTVEPMSKEDIVADAEDSTLPENGATASRIAAEAETKKEAAPFFETDAEAMLIAAAAAAAPEASSRLAEELLQEQTSKFVLKDDSNAATRNEGGELDPHPKCLELDYAFGLLYPATEPAPDVSTCTIAAADIVPNTFCQPMGKTKVSYNPKFPPVVTSVQKDDAFVSDDDSVRYVVKGRVSVFMDAENKVESASLRNSLKSRSSFRRMDAVTKDDKDNEGTGEVVVGSEEGGQWKKVREGAPVHWEKVVQKASPFRSEGKQP